MCACVRACVCVCVGGDARKCAYLSACVRDFEIKFDHFFTFVTQE